MSESGESQPQDDSDEDIYKDFADFNFGDELAKLEHSKETIKKEAFDLSEQVKVLTKENDELKKSNEILKKNMSSLLKTAQAEVQRKDSMIKELRNKIDSFTFKRKNYRTKDAFTSTQDLEITVKMKNGSGEIKNVNDKKRSKSKEYRSSVENERKSHHEEQKKKESEDERKSLNCDNNRKFGYYRDCTKRKPRHSDGHYEPYNKKGSYSNRETSRKGEPDYRSSYNDNHKGHSEYHSLDRRKRSRSTDRRFTYRRRNSRTRRSERVEENSEKWRREKKDVSESIRQRRHSGKDKSRSRECSRGSKESSVDPSKSRSSSDKESGSRIKDTSSNLKETNSAKIDNDESKKGREHSEKEKNEKNQVKTSVKTKRILKEGNSGKNEKPDELDKFSTKSPLDALYNEMMTSRSTSRFSKLWTGITKPEADLEEKSDKTSQQDSHVEEEEKGEDWTLSFKNERKDTVKPMTLYSRRMMQKISEGKETKRLTAEEKTIAQDATLKEMEKSGTEKEPGELTDDESVIESSKEFQELTKVASIDNAKIEKLEETEQFKEPITKEPLIVKNKSEIESGMEETDSFKEVQREIRDIIEYSPFKNNYKLIEISPIKPPDKEQIMELHNKRTASGQLQKEVESSIFNLLSSLTGVPLAAKMEAKETKGEQPKEVQDDSEVKSENKMEQLHSEQSNEKIESKPRSRRNSKSKKSDIKKTDKKVRSIEEENKSKKSDEIVPPGEATQFLDFFLLTTSPSKPVLGQPETPGKVESPTNLSDPKSDSINSSAEKIEVESSKISPVKENSKSEEERKRIKKNESEKTLQKKQDKSKATKKGKEISKKENENKPNSKIQKRKRNSESEPETKKPKVDESFKKRTRSQQNSGNKIDKPKQEPQSETATSVKEDITTFEFFKPIAKKDTPDTPVECKMTAMSVANIVCLETPNKGVTNLKNLMINEQMFLNVLDSKNPALCSPLMTPRRLLKNDLMLTDSEDDSGNKGNVEEEEEGCGMSESENSECESDSGASDFVDLL